MTVLCVDAGTTMVKSVLFDEDGKELAVSRQPTVVSRPEPGHSEQDMYAVWDAVVHTVRSVVHGAGAGGVPRLVAVTGQGDGCWLVGEDGRPTGPAILWNDARASELVDTWGTEGLLDEAYRINGNLGFAGTQSAILTWLRRHDPDRVERADAALYGDGWLFQRFTGRRAVEESDAASPFLDIRTREYSPQLRELLGLEWAERLLPEVLAEDHRVAELSSGPATELRLPAGTPVVMAPFDIPATTIGIGAIDAGQACTILGTTLASQIVVDAAETEGTPSGMTLPLGLESKYVRSLPAMAGVDVINWARALIGLDDPNWLSDLAGLSRRGANGLVFHPYLAPSGERAPFRDSRARGSIIGLSFEHDRRDIARSMLEGLSFVIRDCLAFAPVEISSLRLCGGGANSSFWCQLIADVTGVPTARSTDTEIGAKGAFLTACSIVDGTSVRELVGRCVQPGPTFEPQEEAVADYQYLFEEFMALRETVTQTWGPLAEQRRSHPAERTSQ